MTDAALAFCTTWLMVAFMQVVINGNTHPAWRWGVFAAAGLGMLAKGPVVLVYAGLPTGLWILATGRIRATWQALPWVGGTLLFCAIWAPWYTTAELRTPGYLTYFLLGEHVMRFIDPGWQGDLYGSAHVKPRGTVWLYLLAALGVWTPIAAAAMISRARAAGVRLRVRNAEPHFTYALLCMVVPLLFFTLSRNLIWTYVLPMLSPLAALLARAIERRLDRIAWCRTLVISVQLAWVGLALGWISFAPPQSESRSTAVLVDQWRQESVKEPGPLAYWGERVPHSLRFYARGEAVALTPKTATLPGPTGVTFVVVERNKLPEIEQWLAATHPQLELEILAGNVRWVLTEIEKRDTPPH